MCPVGKKTIEAGPRLEKLSLGLEWSWVKCIHLCLRSPPAHKWWGRPSATTPCRTAPSTSRRPSVRACAPWAQLWFHSADSTQFVSPWLVIMSNWTWLGSFSFTAIASVPLLSLMLTVICSYVHNKLLVNTEKKVQTSPRLLASSLYLAYFATDGSRSTY